MTHVVCWDIDGTLLTTGRAGIIAWQDAVLETCGVTLELDDLHTAGLTDAGIAELLVQRAGLDPDPPRARATLRSYEERLPAALHLREGRVLPGVVAVLEALAARNDARSLLLTGNTRAGAAAKLRHYGLDAYFTDGGFCDAPGPREEIARRALELATSQGDTACHVVVVGDTPHDVRCGEAIGALTVAVATGVYTAEELRSTGASIVLDELPVPEAFFALLSVPPSSALGSAPRTRYAPLLRP